MIRDEGGSPFITGYPAPEGCSSARGAPALDVARTPLARPSSLTDQNLLGVRYAVKLNHATALAISHASDVSRRSVSRVGGRYLEIQQQAGMVRCWPNPDLPLRRLSPRLCGKSAPHTRQLASIPIRSRAPDKWERPYFSKIT
jgi:hypothetical protein